ncbi:IS66 family transposase [Escherichia coli]|uniref:IS66 family transposase n=1 Tax=Escherichia coli TaxID=562 RepID=UPI003D2F8614
MSQKYLIRIAELESQLRQKDQQLSLVEETEAFLRSALARAEEKIEEDEREIEYLRAQARCRKIRLGEAFSYVLNQWDALCYYSDDGLAEADNNTAERALRAFCLGKKNYVFFGSDHGGECGALLYGLIGTCRLNGIDPEAYLRHILSVLPEWPSNRVDELLPWNVVLTNK